MNTAKPELLAAWDNYHRTIEELRHEIERTPRFQNNPEHRAQAVHCLIEAQVMVYNTIIAPRQTQPRVFTHTSLNTLIYSLGQNSGFCRYGVLLLDGHYTYRLTGRVGDVKPMLFQVLSPMLGDPKSVTLGNYELNQFAKPDGSFDVMLSAEKREGCWIQLDANSKFNYVLLRRWFGDWFDDMGEMHIEILDPPAGLPDESEEALASRINVATGYMVYLTREFTIGLYELYLRLTGQKRGEFAYITGESISNDLLGSPSTCYGLAVADCDQDEALIIEGVPPVSDYWSFQLGSVWSKPLDFVNEQVDINMRSITTDPDGKYRIVISHRDPGIRNWLSTVGQREFVIVMRNYNEVGSPKIGAPTMRRIKLTDLSRHLPETTSNISFEQRSRDLARRRKGYELLHH